MRMRWLDASRGIGILLLFPVVFRLALQPAGETMRPAAGAAGTALWYAIELFADQTAFWLLAMCAGCAMAVHRRNDVDERVWTARHRARWLLLLALGLFHGYYLWPASLLPAAALAAILVSGAVRDTACRPLRAAVLAAALPTVVWAAQMENLDRRTAGAGGASWDHFAVSTPDYDAWESASYRGSWSEQNSARRAQWTTRVTEQGPLRDCWHMGAGMLFGLWWERAGRHRRRRPRAGELIAAGLGVNAAAASMHMGPFEPGLAARIADMANYAGGALLAAGILAAATRADLAHRVSRGREALCRIGRRPLTAFGAVTLAAAAVGHGWGLGLHGMLTPAESFAITVALGTATAAALVLLPPKATGRLEQWRGLATENVVATARQRDESGDSRP